MKKEIDKGFLDQLPETGHISIDELYPRLDELKKIRRKFFRSASPGSMRSWTDWGVKRAMSQPFYHSPFGGKA